MAAFNTDSVEQTASAATRSVRRRDGATATVRSDARAAAVLAAEVRHLVGVLRDLGPLPRATLARAAGSAHWREGTFDAAVREGVRQGQLKELPFDFVTLPPPEPNEPKRRRVRTKYRPLPR